MVVGSFRFIFFNLRKNTYYLKKNFWGEKSHDEKYHASVKHRSGVSAVARSLCQNQKMGICSKKMGI
jgi:hypothetical protein